MFISGVIACGCFLSVNPLCKIFKENYILIYGGFLVMVLGRIAHIPFRDELPKMQAFPKEIHFDNGTSIIYKDDDPEVLGCPISQEWCKTTGKLGLPEFILGYLLTSMGYPIGLTLINTIFSKVLGPRPQGNWMGIITNAGCLSRITGPICIMFLYTRYGTYWTFLSMLILCLVPMILLMILKDRLYIENFKPSPKSVEMENLNPKSENENDINHR
jgi:ceroid-lipofuscinosis MFS transporter 7